MAGDCVSTVLIVQYPELFTLIVEDYLAYTKQMKEIEVAAVIFPMFEPNFYNKNIVDEICFKLV